jgi:hypothetical protein
MRRWRRAATTKLAPGARDGPSSRDRSRTVLGEPSVRAARNFKARKQRSPGSCDWLALHSRSRAPLVLNWPDLLPLPSDQNAK